jgi:LPXTG-motif cell wall-anchored protein
MYKKIIAMIAAFMLVMMGLVAIQSPASATRNNECTPSTAHTERTGWLTDSPGEGWEVFKTRTVGATDPIPAVTHKEAEFSKTIVVSEAKDEKVIDTPYKAAVTKTQYEFEHAPHGIYKTRWEDNPNWNAESNSHSKGWAATGNTREVVVTPEQAEVSHIEHTDEVTETVTDWFSERPGAPWEFTGKTRTVTDHEAIPGSEGTTEYKFKKFFEAVTCEQPEPKKEVCHPVNGKGELGNGWNIIPPDQASSHIDEETGAGFHESKDGRTDVYAVDGKCPGGATYIDIPAALDVLDPCDSGNATWDYKGDTSNDFSWDLTDDGELTAIAHEGFLFENGDKTVPFGKAPETNTAPCVKTITDIPDFNVTDPCGIGNAVWNLEGGSPSNEFTLDLDVEGPDGVLTLIAADGFEFEGGAHTKVIGKAVDSGILCPVEPGTTSGEDVATAVTSSYECDDNFVTLTTTTTTTPWTQVEGQAKVFGTPVVDTKTTTEPHAVVACEKPPVEEPKPPVDEPKPPVDKPEPPKVDTPVTAPKPPVKHAAPAVPTAVDAGLASLPNTGANDYSGLIGLVGGMMILVGAVLFFRKRA